MGRKRRIQGIILIAGILSSGCLQRESCAEAEVRISFSNGEMQSRAADPDEEKLSDISLMIFDMSGSTEGCFHLEGGETECSARLLTGKKYIFCACANFGYPIYADDISELDDIVYQMAYPDEYREGIPMYAYQEVTIGGEGTNIPIRLERLMAKVSLRMDRSLLSDNVEIFVKAVRIGNCPRAVKVFGESRVQDGADCFPAGFSRRDRETDNLNIVSESGLSGEISLYMLENMQGDMPEHTDSDSGKIFRDDDPRKDVCSYIEMELEYMSDEYISEGRGLIYRFYLGEDRNSLDMERNSHYRITVTPEDDGLKDDGWRVDKSSLTYCGPTYLKSYPSGYIAGNIGDRIHIWCELLPENAPFDVGTSDMEFDRANGIYDYVIDEDGHGAVLTLTGPGVGMIYMEAGPPINDAALFYIEVFQP